MAIAAARRFLTDRLVRVEKPHRLLGPDAGPLVAVPAVDPHPRDARRPRDRPRRARARGVGEPLGGAYAAGEISGFGGGGVHGYRALEGTFLGGRLVSGRVAGRAVAAAVG